MTDYWNCGWAWNDDVDRFGVVSPVDKNGYACDYGLWKDLGFAGWSSFGAAFRLDFAPNVSASNKPCDFREFPSAFRMLLDWDGGIRLIFADSVWRLDDVVAPLAFERVRGKDNPCVEFKAGHIFTGNRLYLEHLYNSSAGLILDEQNPSPDSKDYNGGARLFFEHWEIKIRKYEAGEVAFLATIGREMCSVLAAAHAFILSVKNAKGCNHPVVGVCERDNAPS